MTEHEKVIDKVRKLLAKSSGTENEHEAAAFLAKAQSILAEYNLSLSDVSIEEQSNDEIVISSTDDLTSSQPWRRSIATACASMYFCRYFWYYKYFDRPNAKNDGSYKRMDEHNFVGAAHNVEVAKLMFEYLHTTVERLAKEGAKKVPSNERSKYITTFRHVCTQRLCKRIWHMINEAKNNQTSTASGTTMPAVADLYDTLMEQIARFMDENFGEMETKKVKPVVSSLEGYHDGRVAGSTISLNTQINNDDKASHHLLK